ncbi:MAG: argininosuccinate synthase [Deltaproteobacteria bacterium]|nr:argininosuccinate synthase [Deltaproteobacteria bacterium]
MSKSYQKVSSYEAEKGSVKRAVLLYSGGLDTSCILKWIQDEYQIEVVTLTLDLGQQVDDLKAIQKKALALGAKAAYLLDVRDEFADRYLSYAIKANGTYQYDYYISTISRYLIAEKAIEVAAQEKADAIAHGCTGKGNDQIRIEAACLALKPDIKIIATVREWALGREEELDYAQQHGIEVPVRHDFPYSSDDNMWGVTWESGEIEDISTVPKIDQFLTVTPIEKTPDKPEMVEITFKEGLPVAINGKSMKLASLIKEANLLGAKHGVGVKYMVEDRVVGLKVRGIYEHPGAEIIISAHRKLEALVSTRLENEFKAIVDLKWGELCYGAQWFDPLMGDLNAFCANLNQRVNGTVKVKLFKGKAEVVALESPYAIYDDKLATFMKDYSFNQNCSASFIELYSLQMKLANQKIRENAQ